MSKNKYGKEYEEYTVEGLSEEDFTILGAEEDQEEPVRKPNRISAKRKQELRAQRLKKKRRKKRLKITLFILEIIVFLVMTTALVFLAVPNAKQKFLGTCVGDFLMRMVLSEDDYNKNVHDSNFNGDSIKINDGLSKDILDDYLNVVLFGLDGRDEDFNDENLSDSIIVASISKKTGTVKMVSIYRDSYIENQYDEDDLEFNKINQAYAQGGAEAAVQTLNRNLDLDIEDYVAINFSGVATIVDLLGGIRVNLTRDEVYSYYGINGYLTETRKITGIKTPNVTEYGDQILLNGMQVAAYCRLRYVKFYDEVTGEGINNDFGRTARQRLVIKKLVDKIKSASLSQVNDIAKEILNGTGDKQFVKTSMSYDEIMKLIPVLLEFSLGESAGFPFEYKDKNFSDAGSSLVPASLSTNVTKLHEFLFDVNNYKPTSTVEMISNRLIGLTGVEAIETTE